MGNPKISIDLAKLAARAPTGIPRIIEAMTSKGITPPSWLGWASILSGFMGEIITTGDDAPDLPFNIGPEGSGLSSYWRTHSQWTDESVYNASECIIGEDVPSEFQATADNVANLIKFTTSALSNGSPPTREQYRKAVDTILRESNSSGVRRYGDLLYFTLKLHRDK